MGAGSRWDKALPCCWPQAALQVSHISWLLWDFQPQGVILRSLRMRITQWHFSWLCCFCGEDVLALFYKGFLPGPSSLPPSPPHPVHATGKQKRKAKFSDQKDSFAQTLQRTMHTDNNAAEQQLFDKVPLRRCHQKLNAILPMVHTHTAWSCSPQPMAVHGTPFLEV